MNFGHGDIIAHKEFGTARIVMDGFAMMEDGQLILCDECGNFRYCPDGRFDVFVEFPADDF